MRQRLNRGTRPGAATVRARQAASRQRANRNTRASGPRRRVLRSGAYQDAARNGLRRYRQGSLLAVAITAWLLLALGVPGQAQDTGAAAATAPVITVAEAAQPADAPQGAQGAAAARDEAPVSADTTGPADISRSVEEATSTVRELSLGFMSILPKLLFAIGMLLAAALITAIVRPLLRRALRSWTRADAVAALAGIAIWLVAISVALTVVVGDPRALLGSVGLIGLALSWALQSPIESFTAWLLNSFRGYYRVGDRIGVGEVFGDVFRIDFLTTTVWEAGGPDKPVQGAQPTGALVTFPNSEVLRANVVNYTRDFPYVWDELVVPLARESDLDYAADVLLRIAGDTVGVAMAAPAEAYRRLLGATRLDIDIASEPQIFFSQGNSWTDATIRYLVDARRRRVTASDLLRAIARELPRAEHRGRLVAANPVTRVAVVDPADLSGA